MVTVSFVVICELDVVGGQTYGNPLVDTRQELVLGNEGPLCWMDKAVVRAPLAVVDEEAFRSGFRTRRGPWPTPQPNRLRPTARRGAQNDIVAGQSKPHIAGDLSPTTRRALGAFRRARAADIAQPVRAQNTANRIFIGSAGEAAHSGTSRAREQGQLRSAWRFADLWVVDYEQCSAA